jgi:hypothetical protein
MQLSEFNGWRRLWAIFSVSYFIPVALITIYVAYCEEILLIVKPSSLSENSICITLKCLFLLGFIA